MSRNIIDNSLVASVCMANLQLDEEKERLGREAML